MRTLMPELPGTRSYVSDGVCHAVTPRSGWFRPRVVLALPDVASAAAVDDRLRRCGWSVYRVASATDARRLVRELAPSAVVLPAESDDESGWLACAKLLRLRPGLRIVLVDDSPTADRERFTAFVGAAALVPDGPGLPARLEQELMPAVPAAC
jgi:hypothetical protein